MVNSVRFPKPLYDLWESWSSPSPSPHLPSREGGRDEGGGTSPRSWDGSSTSFFLFADAVAEARPGEVVVARRSSRHEFPYLPGRKSVSSVSLYHVYHIIIHYILGNILLQSSSPPPLAEPRAEPSSSMDDNSADYIQLDIFYPSDPLPRSNPKCSLMAARLVRPLAIVIVRPRHPTPLSSISLRVPAARNEEFPP